VEKEPRTHVLTEASVPQPKLAKGFGNHAFEGEGDAFVRKKNQGNACSPKPQFCRQNSARASTTMHLKASMTIF
jgi:hypothetical protein